MKCYLNKISNIRTIVMILSMYFTYCLSVSIPFGIYKQIVSEKFVSKYDDIEENVFKRLFYKRKAFYFKSIIIKFHS